MIKYPRTPHLPWSKGVSADDKKIKSLDRFIGKRVVCTEKMDGENTTMYFDKIHARSIDSKDHLSRHRVKNFHNKIKHLIPRDIRICGENLYAKHSIHYENLESYFLGFGIFRDNQCLPWDETLSLFEIIGITPVKVLYKGIYDENTLRRLEINEEKSEGYVIRLDSFNVKDFDKSVAKYVRKNHVQTDKHWMNSKIEKNLLRSGNENKR